MGQMVCGVVADSREHAKLGAAAVKIHYQDLPDPVFTVEVSTHCGGGSDGGCGDGGGGDVDDALKL